MFCNQIYPFYRLKTKHIKNKILINIMNTKLLHNKVGDIHSDGVVQCSSVQWFQCNGLQCSGVQCSALKCSLEQCSAEQRSAEHYCTELQYTAPSLSQSQLGYTRSIKYFYTNGQILKIFYAHSGCDKTNLTSLIFFGCFYCFKTLFILLVIYANPNQMKFRENILRSSN